MTLITIESIASEPIIPPASLTLLAIWTEAAVLTRNICTIKGSGLKAVFGQLLLSKSWDVSRSQEFVDKSLVLTNSIGEHASMITIVVDTPLDIYDLSGTVRRYRRTPIVGGLVVVDTDASVVSARSASSDLGTREIWPSCNWFKNCTLRARIKVRLYMYVSMATQT